MDVARKLISFENGVFKKNDGLSVIQWSKMVICAKPVKMWVYGPYSMDIVYRT